MFSGRLHQTWLRLKALWKRPQLDRTSEARRATRVGTLGARSKFPLRETPS